MATIEVTAPNASRTVALLSAFLLFASLLAACNLDSGTGVLESVKANSDGTVTVKGWAATYNADHPSVTVMWDIRNIRGSTKLNIGKAKDSRPDIQAISANLSSDHGFTERIELPPGKTEICAYATGPKGTKFLLENCHEVTVPRARAKSISPPCAIMTDGRTACWGRTTFEILNGPIPYDPDRSDHRVMTEIPDAIDVAIGPQPCFLRKSGKVYCWERTADNVKRAEMRQIENLANVEQITSGASRGTCAIDTAGAVWCWGSEANGALGYATPPVVIEPGDPVPGLEEEYWPDPQQAVDIDPAIDVAMNGLGTCAITTSGETWCWGKDLINSPEIHKSELAIPRQLVTGDTAAALKLGTDHGCIAMTSGAVSCWGTNSHGQLGVVGVTESEVPIPVPGITNAVDVSAGNNYSCALLSTGRVKCWGANHSGTLGNGNKNDSSVPTEVLNLRSVVELKSSGSSSCALDRSGDIRCWGTTWISNENLTTPKRLKLLDGL